MPYSAAETIHPVVDNPADPLAPAAHTNDGFFKAVFSQPVCAIAFFKSHLPPAIVARIDWKSLTVLPGSFIKSSLQQIHSDLLFSVRSGDRETLLYLLFEHQSTPDPAMPLRLLGYVVEILIQHHKAHGMPLPPVLPIVLHQGPDTWNVSSAFEDLFDLPDELAADLLPFLPKFQHALLDLTQCDPATEEGDTRLRIVLQLMKLARERQLLQFFQWLAESLVEQLPDSFLGQLLLYALHSDSDLDIEQIFHKLSSNPELEQSTMSVAEKLIAKGRTEGRTEGRLEGRTQGFWSGKIQTLQEFLDLPVTQRQTLEAMELAELEALHAGLHREYEVRFKR